MADKSTASASALQRSSCPSQESILRLLSDELASTEAAGLEAHIETCPACQEMLEHLTDMRRQGPLAESAAAFLCRLEHDFQTGNSPNSVTQKSSAREGNFASLEIPLAVAGYEIIAELGRGGMGIVYQARQKVLGRLVALKMILSAELAGDKEVRRFRLEAEAIARLQHPNIVQIYEVGEENRRPFLALEYVNGGSLAQLTGRPMPPRDCAQLVRTLAGAIDYAHRRGVIHRDLKPANILLQVDCGPQTGSPKLGQAVPSMATANIDWTSGIDELRAAIPKITDFGLAKRLDADLGYTQTGTILGSPPYMAPEQANGRVADLAPATDIFSIGVILYELLVGRRPFDGSTILQTLEQVRSHDPPPPSMLQLGIPRDMDAICLKCLEKRPQDRYQSAADLASDLDSFLAGEPIQARSANLIDNLRRTLGRFDHEHKLGSWGNWMIVLSPIVLVVHILAYLLFQQLLVFPIIISWISIASAAGIPFALYWADRTTFRLFPAFQRRHLTTIWASSSLGMVLMWFIIWWVTPPGQPEYLLVVYPLWMLMQGTGYFAFAADVGAYVIIGAFFYLVAIGTVFVLPWSPLVVSALVMVAMLTQGLIFRVFAIH